jgi:hypothetical protein
MISLKLFPPFTLLLERIQQSMVALVKVTRLSSMTDI